MRWDAIIFDMDGVLFDSESLHCRAWLDTMSGFGHQVSEASVMAYVGKACRDLALHYQENMAPRRPWQEYLEGKRSAYQNLVRKELVPFAGLPETLDRLARKLPLGLATSSERQDVELMLAVGGVRRFFGAVVTHEDVAMHKPHPEAYLLAASRLGADPLRCVALDDSPTGIASAKAAGMLTLGIASTFPREMLSGSDLCFASTMEACRWLEDEGNQE